MIQIDQVQEKHQKVRVALKKKIANCPRTSLLDNQRTAKWGELMKRNFVFEV